VGADPHCKKVNVSDKTVQSTCMLLLKANSPECCTYNNLVVFAICDSSSDLFTVICKNVAHIK